MNRWENLAWIIVYTDLQTKNADDVVRIHLIDFGLSSHVVLYDCKHLFINDGCNSSLCSLLSPICGMASVSRAIAL
jgi:hypothetical protein